MSRQDIIKARREIVKIALQDYINITKEKLENLADNYTNIHEKLWHLFDGAEDTLIYIKENKIEGLRKLFSRIK
jgi:hypothetical protein